MYIKPAKIKQKTLPWGIETTITHIGLYKDDGTYVKFLAHNDKIIQKLLDTKIEVTIPEIQDQIKEHEIDKLLPKSTAKLGEVTLF